MTETEVTTGLEAARAELDPISSEIQELISGARLHTPEGREALRSALAKYDAAAEGCSGALATYYDLLLSGRLPG
jgi:hypothetical protein